MALSKSPNNVQLAAWLYSDEHEKGEGGTLGKGVR
jgi:hypothetical protein